MEKFPKNIEQFTYQERKCGGCWLHESKRFWIVYYDMEDEKGKPPFYVYESAEYRSAAFPDRPWSFGNKRVGKFMTLDECVKFVETYSHYNF